jgi:hypothetical protein
MTAIDNLIDALFDYAGLFPPASLELRPALDQYVGYRRGKDAHALGRFVINLDRISSLRDLAGECFRSMKLSVLARPDDDWDLLARLFDNGALIESIEIKNVSPSEVAGIARQLPTGLPAYFEVPFDSGSTASLDAICAAGASAKLRMGGLVAEAFPLSQSVAGMLQSMAERHLSFKATAGLHHPLRGCHPFTGAPASASGKMHGFVNLCCAATLIHLGREEALAATVLEETDPYAWRIAADSIGWRDLTWRSEQIRATRQEFFVSVGSCSFTDPVADLEALGWR